ncbi:MAG: ubiquinone/menaquinone biosynthesis methyltransferase [Thermoguttaceae bacterium]|jgi:demethylmenaquinone methyltransferase/2-methoxy-6-polyprenyl-1,4-benzoquinol methylase|nr:ubiquinone/menaquinone biosynthesis methyltransferase [Thermoguttaceae bacterium]
MTATHPPAPPPDGRAVETVRDLFVPVPRTYERINHLLTLGLDRYWRWRAVGMALRTGGADYLDVCTGTGEMAAALCCRGGPGIRVSAIDFSVPMLAYARAKPGSDRIAFYEGDAAALPFPDAAFDAVTISFALRNLNVTRQRFVRCLTECRRVLRRDGRLITVETTQPPWQPLRAVLHGYARWVVPRAGARLSGARPPYAYLAATIPAFYSAPGLAGILREAGFSKTRYTYLTGGLVAIHRAWP